MEPIKTLAQKASFLDAAVDLCAELAVVHKLKERVLLGRSEEPRTARGILPQDNDLTLEPFKRGCSLQSRIGGASFARLRCRLREWPPRTRETISWKRS